MTSRTATPGPANRLRPARPWTTQPAAMSWRSICTRARCSADSCGSIIARNLSCRPRHAPAVRSRSLVRHNRLPSGRRIVAVPAPHTAVSYDEVAALVQAELGRGYQPKKAGRRRLLDLVVELRDAEPAGSSGLMEGRTWRILSIAVRGIGGIGVLDPPRVELTPTAGLTVIRGQNGHGKTSL